MVQAVHLPLADKRHVELCSKCMQTEDWRCTQDACCMPVAGSRLGQGVRSLYLLLANLGAT